MEKTVGVYHANCIDGTASAAVLMRKFPDISLFPLSNGYTPEELEVAREGAREANVVYIVDCALGIREFLADGHKVVVLDHHIGIKDDMEKLAHEEVSLTFIFDNEKSGASLAWGYFFSEEPMPDLIRYVEDNDLWTMNYGDERKYTVSYLSMFRNQPEVFLPLFDSDLKGVIGKGEVISTYIDQEVEHLIEVPPRDMRIGEYVIPAFNITVHKSVCGSLLSEKHGKAVALYTIKGDGVTISFRSKEGQVPTARTLAEMLGGGGHDHSAAARPTFEDFLKTIS